MAETAAKKKPRVNMARAWAEARALIWKYRRSLAIGLGLMLINRPRRARAPASSKYLIDDAGQQQLAKLAARARRWRRDGRTGDRRSRCRRS
jgi:hypothetical protein